jgi:phytoene synthase
MNSIDHHHALVSAATLPAGDMRHCAEIVKALDRDRYVATLFAPERPRGHLFALYAFAMEIARVREIVSDALPGEMRFQWWRDILEGDMRGDVAAHPVATSLISAMIANNLPRQALIDLIEARTFDLYDDLFADWTELEGYCGATSSALIRMASIILAEGRDPGGAEAAGHAGCAYGITGLLRAFPWHSRRGQVYVPASLLSAVGLDRGDIVNGKDTPALRAALAEMRARARHHLAETRARIGTVEARTAPAFLPLVTVDAYLAAMEAPDYDPFQTVIDVPQWRRIWMVWRQAGKASR